MFRLPRIWKRTIWTVTVFCLLLGFGLTICAARAAADQTGSKEAKQSNKIVSDQASSAAGSGEKGGAALEGSGSDRQYREAYEKAVVLEVDDTKSNKSETAQMSVVIQKIKVRVLSGPYEGQEIESSNSIIGTPGMDVILKPGDHIVLNMIIEEGKDGRESVQSVNVADRLRSPALGWLLLLFAGLILIIGRFQGLKSLLGLGATALGIYMILLPGLMAGKNALPLTIMVLIGVTLITMIFVAGFSRKCLAATLGTLGGLIIAGLLAYIFGDLAYLSGLSTEEERMLLYVENVKIDMRGLLFSGILIGALGAVMDVAMSVASTVSEVKKADPEMKAWPLMRAGMNVGRDIMGTMANTLILAYTGSALPMMLLFMAYKMEPARILNWEMIATEIVRALVGSIALILCIPITALVAGWLNSSVKSAESSLVKNSALY